jgi:hypothetical protein
MATSRRGRSRGGRRRASPPVQLLEHDLQRRNLARAERERLLTDIRATLEIFPQLAARRTGDRQALLNKAAGELLAWAALIAERGPDGLPQRLFAAVGSLLSPCDPWWAGLLVSGLQKEVIAHIATSARRARDADPTDANAIRLAPAELRAIPMLRQLVDQIEARSAGAAEVRAVAIELLVGAMGEAPEAFDESGAVLDSSLALSLLEEPLPITDEYLNGTLADALAGLAADFPSMLDHAQSHADDPDFASEEDEANDEDLDDDPGPSLSLAKGLGLVDKRLAMTEDPDEGAMLARMAATLLLLSCTQLLAGHELQLGIESRLWAALVALNSEEEGLPVRDLPEASLELVAQDLRRAAGFLEFEVPTVSPVAAPADSFSRLDALISALSEAAESEDLEDSLAASLGLAGAAVEVIRAGIGLAGTPKSRDGHVKALAVLDPSALNVDRKARLKAAREVGDLARAVAGG